MILDKIFLVNISLNKDKFYKYFLLLIGNSLS